MRRVENPPPPPVRNYAHYHQALAGVQLGLGYTLALEVPIELPPVGIILLRNGPSPPAASTLIKALHEETMDIGGQTAPE